jgi:hypothetical protein
MDTEVEKVEATVMITKGDFTTKADDFYNGTRLIAIRNQDEYEFQADILLQIKSYYKTLDQQRKDTKQPFDDAVKNLQAMFKVPLDKLIKAEGLIKQAMLKYNKEQEKIRKEAEEKLREEQEVEARKKREEAEVYSELSKEAESEGNIIDAGDYQDVAEIKKMEATAISNTEIVIKQKKTRGIATTKVWKYKVKNFDKIPRNYLMVNDKMLTALAKATKNTMKIEGIEFYYEDTIKAGGR